MEFIQICEYKGEAVTTSRAVAEQFGKQHKNVIQSIESIIEELNRLKNQPVNPENELNAPKIQPVNPENEINALKIEAVKPENDTQTAEFADRNFILSEYTDTKGETRKQYILTRDGFTLLAMGFTGAKAMQFKVAYINAFNRMESIINGEARLETAKREASRSIEQVNSYAESNSLDSVATDSIEAMRTAYNTGLIAFTRKRTGEKSGSGEVVGVYDDFTVSIFTTELHKLYASHTGDNMPFNVWIGIVKRKLKYQNNHRDRARLTMSREEANIIL